jgi:Kef-type K+ transport system membrane component KefB
MTFLFLKKDHSKIMIKSLGKLTNSFLTNRRMARNSIIAILFLAVITLSSPVFAAGPAEETKIFSNTFLLIAIILIFAKLVNLVQRFGLPVVLGELLVGIVLGNLYLLGFNFFEAIKHNLIIKFLSELGVVILLFQIGLESNIQKISQVGFRALLVAVLGVIIPFVSGTYLIGPFFFPSLSFNSYLFLGAALTATSVGITVRIFRDLRKTNAKEAQIVLGAAVIDDVLGLIILAAVSAMVTVGSINASMIGLIIAKAVGFLVGAIILGQLSAPILGKWFAKFHNGAGMKFTLAISFGLVFAFLANSIGLAAIIGSFAAGLILDPIHFRYFNDPELISKIKKNITDGPDKFKKKINQIINAYAHRHVEDLIEPIGYFVIPIFFVATGTNVDLRPLFNLSIISIASLIAIIAILGKVISGIAAGKANKLIVGFGMAPRGEVGLIFATVGKSLGVIDSETFSVIIVVLILTTLITPPILTYLIQKKSIKESSVNPLPAGRLELT